MSADVVSAVGNEEKRAHRPVEPGAAAIKRRVKIKIGHVNTNNPTSSSPTICCELSANHDSTRAVRPDDRVHRATRAGNKSRCRIKGSSGPELYETLRSAARAELAKRAARINVSGR